MENPKTQFQLILEEFEINLNKIVEKHIKLIQKEMNDLRKEYLEKFK